MDSILKLHDDTKIFFGNQNSNKFKFCTKIEPQSKWYIDHKIKHYGVPSNMATEKNFNVFLRCRNPELQKWIHQNDPLKVMEYLLKMKK